MANLREVLEAAILENPDDKAAHMAWADHLAEMGDPRGEFAQVQWALEDESRSLIERQELKEREEELLRAHDAEWIGEAAEAFEGGWEYPQFDLGWTAGSTFAFRRGWLDSLDLDNASAKFLDALARGPAIALLRRLEIRGDTFDGESCIDALPRLLFGPRLRTFILGRDGCSLYSERRDFCGSLACFPNIEEMRF